MLMAAGGRVWEGSVELQCCQCGNGGLNQIQLAMMSASGSGGGGSDVVSPSPGILAQLCRMVSRLS